ncbi:MAG: ABC transporter permease subunit [Clostridiales bacterium]|nr:ABC transporter permease subunit [Clostridiales bacterium]
MVNLLSANFLRLRKSLVFWLCTAYMLYDGLRLFYHSTQMVQEGTYRDAPSFQFMFLGGIVFALHCSFFVSGEYGDGAIRNKLTVGASRTAVYLANLITCTTACLLMCAAYILPNWTLEYFLVGKTGGLSYSKSSSYIALVFVVCILVVLSFNAIFTMIGMNIQRKALGSVVILLTAAALIYFGQEGRDMLLLRQSAPERYSYPPLTILRYQLFSDWLPGGQAIFCHYLGYPQAPETMILHSLIVIIVSTAAGLLLFQRKDLK